MKIKELTYTVIAITVLTALAGAVLIGGYIQTKKPRKRGK